MIIQRILCYNAFSLRCSFTSGYKLPAKSHQPTANRLIFRRSVLDSLDLARHTVEIVEDKKAEEIVLLDLRPDAIIADFFVICNGNSDRQLKALVDGYWRLNDIAPVSEFYKNHELGPVFEGRNFYMICHATAL